MPGTPTFASARKPRSHVARGNIDEALTAPRGLVSHIVHQTMLATHRATPDRRAVVGAASPATKASMRRLRPASRWPGTL